MKILSMTATFGKLEHAAIQLKPGLNVIHAPNEWGKSTWCAFLVNMLYGIDTRARSSGNVLADKERYAPWSGAAMSGRIELLWNDRKITIERSSKGRTPFGEFRAYETETGMDVPELTAANCGQTLLGVERSVFSRAGFLRLNDLPVTQDEALRRRLNNLVTTGDETGAGDQLGQTLKELKNKCRFNNTGLLPQAENEREQLRTQLHNLQSVNQQIETIIQRQAQVQKELADLENHKAALHYKASVDAVEQVRAADAATNRLKQELEQLQLQCAQLPSRQQLEKDLALAQALVAKHTALAIEKKALPSAPQAPAPCSLDAQQAQQDYSQLEQLETQKNHQIRTTPILALGLAVGILAVAVTLAILLQQSWLYIVGGVGLLLAAGSIWIAGGKKAKAITRQIEALKEKYPGIAPKQWVEFSKAADAQQKAYEKSLSEYEESKQSLENKSAELDAEMLALAGKEAFTDYIARLEKQIQLHEQAERLTEELSRASKHADALRNVAKLEQPPTHQDALTYTLSETTAMLTRLAVEKQELQLNLGQAMGKAESLGDEKQLHARIDTLNRRILRLEETFHALELAQEALYQATTSLQRRFAPMIAKHTQEYFAGLTDGRYQRLTIGEDLSLNVSAENEDTLHGSHWRSDGTVDQLYFAMRLAVAKELTPQAPLVLDDALVRFDDVRLAKAMEILQTESQSKQVILFTCQDRESRFLENS